MRLAGGDRAVVERIAHAPRTYLLAQDAADVARQAALLEPLPQPGRARVAVDQLEGESHEWRVEVASRDRPGLLATVTGVLSDSGLSVQDAVVATWADGGALESFRVVPTRGAPPDDEALTAAIVEAFDRPLEAPPTPGAEVVFDDDASPWYTLCEVRSVDRPGLLHAITAAFASAGVDVHSARVRTVEGQAADRFEVTDRNGRKLGEPAKRAVIEALTGGVRTGRRGRLLRRR